MAIVDLAVVQAGVESGTGAVAAKVLLDLEPGQATLEETHEPIVLHRAGSLSAGRTEPGPRSATLSLKDVVVSYEDIVAILNGLCTPAAAVAGTTDYTWTHVPPDVPDGLDWRYTFEVGATDQWPEEYRLSGCALSKLVLKGKPGDFWRMDADFVALLLEEQSKTLSLAPRTTLHHIPFAGTVLSLDSSSVFGTTPLTGLVDGFELTIEDGKTSLRGTGNADDPRFPQRIERTKRRTVTAKITAEWDSAAYRAAFLAGTPQRLRLSQVGASLGASHWTATIDIAGTWRSMPHSESDGLMMLDLELGGQYDSSIAADWKATIVNNLAVSPWVSGS